MSLLKQHLRIRNKISPICHRNGTFAAMLILSSTVATGGNVGPLALKLCPGNDEECVAAYGIPEAYHFAKGFHVSFKVDEHGVPDIKSEEFFHNLRTDCDLREFDNLDQLKYLSMKYLSTTCDGFVIVSASDSFKHIVKNVVLGTEKHNGLDASLNNIMAQATKLPVSDKISSSKDGVHTLAYTIKSSPVSKTSSRKNGVMHLQLFGHLAMVSKHKTSQPVSPETTPTEPNSSAQSKPPAPKTDTQTISAPTQRKKSEFPEMTKSSQTTDEQPQRTEATGSAEMTASTPPKSPVTRRHSSTPPNVQSMSSQSVDSHTPVLPPRTHKHAKPKMQTQSTQTVREQSTQTPSEVTSELPPMRESPKEQMRSVGVQIGTQTNSDKKEEPRSGTQTNSDTQTISVTNSDTQTISVTQKKEEPRSTGMQSVPQKELQLPSEQPKNDTYWTFVRAPQKTEKHSIEEQKLQAYAESDDEGSSINSLDLLEMDSDSSWSEDSVRMLSSDLYADHSPPGGVVAGSDGAVVLLSVKETLDTAASSASAAGNSKASDEQPVRLTGFRNECFNIGWV